MNKIVSPTKHWFCQQNVCCMLNTLNNIALQRECQHEFAIPHRILRLVSDYSEDASDKSESIVGHLRLCLGCQNGWKILRAIVHSSKIRTTTGVAMPKIFATSRRRPESAFDGCKIVRSVSRFCLNYPGFTHRRGIANDLWLRHK